MYSFRMKLYITYAIQALTSVGLFLSAIGCSQYESPKVVSSSNNNGQNLDPQKKLTQSESLRTIQLVKASLTSTEELNRVLDIVLLGANSTKLSDKCQEYKLETLTPTEDKITLSSTSRTIGCMSRVNSSWEGSETILVTYADASRDDSKRILKIIKTTDNSFKIKQIMKNTKRSTIMYQLLLLDDRLEITSASSTDKYLFNFKYNDPDNRKTPTAQYIESKDNASQKTNEVSASATINITATGAINLKTNKIKINSLTIDQEETNNQDANKEFISTSILQPQDSSIEMPLTCNGLPVGTFQAEQKIVKLNEPISSATFTPVIQINAAGSISALGMNYLLKSLPCGKGYTDIQNILLETEQDILKNTNINTNCPNGHCGRVPVTKPANARDSSRGNPAPTDNSTSRGKGVNLLNNGNKSATQGDLTNSNVLKLE